MSTKGFSVARFLLIPNLRIPPDLGSAASDAMARKKMAKTSKRKLRALDRI
jgi:hypothetical protein